jgi:hypothetical protein
MPRRWNQAARRVGQNFRLNFVQFASIWFNAVENPAIDNNCGTRQWLLYGFSAYSDVARVLPAKRRRFNYAEAPQRFLEALQAALPSSSNMVGTVANMR